MRPMNHKVFLFIMAKDPAFLFYSSDFLNGIADLTMEERGQYITLLCLQHQKGELTDKTIRLSLGLVSVDVISKFTKLKNGNFVNDRLIIEMERRKLFTESRKNNGKKGGRPKKPLGYPKNNLMEDENENENKDIIIDKNKKNNFSKNLFNDPQWNEDICRMNKINSDILLKYLNIFDLKLKSELETKINKQEYAIHFSRWLKIELKNEKKDQLNGKEKLTGAQAFLKQFE